MSLESRDLQHIWHPCSQMKDYETFAPLPIVAAEGSYITLNNGQKIIDAISSWWCKSLGHGHPRLKAALKQQVEKFEHVIFANTTHEAIVSLSEKLTALSPALKKVFYASEGSSAVEIALKMAIHAQQLKNQPQKKRIVALRNGYHGETLFALMVSDLALYKKPYEHWLQPIIFIDPPYVNTQHMPLWQNADEAWKVVEQQLNTYQDEIAAIIVEPIMQGAAGMQLYSANFLKHLHDFAKKNDIYLIADEIMTGMGRTGKWLACEHAGVEPDLLCLGKGLTAGFLPFSAVLLTNELYDLFYDDYATGKSFLHSHTFSGHALGAAVALACLSVIEEESILEKATDLEKHLQGMMQQVATETGALTNVRGIGGIVAADLLADKPRLGYQIFQEAVKQGALLRPLGNTVYWFPPLNISIETLENLRDITIKAIRACS
jgi:adenosylmethionine-8-amino-7-oxononanoate aminotransferase